MQFYASEDLVEGTLFGHLCKTILVKKFFGAFTNEFETLFDPDYQLSKFPKILFYINSHNSKCRNIFLT